MQDLLQYAVLILLVAGCVPPDCKDPNRNRYDLEVPLSVAPAKQIYTLKDTIIFSIEVSNKVTNLFNGRQENYP